MNNSWVDFTKCAYWSHHTITPANYASLFALDCALSVINGLTSPATFASNALILFAILKTPLLHTPTNVLVFSLVLADSLVGILLQPLAVVYLLIEGNTCTVIDALTFLNVTVIGVSLSTMALVSLDLYLSLYFPFRYPSKVTIRRVSSVSIIVWLYWTIMVAIPMVTPGRTAMLLVESVLGVTWLVCLVVIAISYFRIFWLVRYHVTKIKTLTPVEHTGPQPIGDREANVNHRGSLNLQFLSKVKEKEDFPVSDQKLSVINSKPISTCSQAVSCQQSAKDQPNITRPKPITAQQPVRARKTKLAVTMGYVIGTSLFCYFPFGVVVLFLRANPNPSLSLVAAFYVLITLQFLSSFVNPLVYCWRVRELREACSTLLRSLGRRFFN
ncbi:predicted protein [Nematostella vectensis]|uniref:G-protein coupled receptors family 1 profile domain-containing protein n=1 Tax=Nematostella vectensis TaxID=45351 RepID=A7RXX8_NEMVE|nr:predicted protein [Nematostella vectensis]|eukprot:XP_001635803.1 predicted protein [Nematostella vectensis]